MADPHLPEPRPNAGTRVIRSDRLRREHGTGLADTADGSPSSVERPTDTRTPDARARAAHGRRS